MRARSSRIMALYLSMGFLLTSGSVAYAATSSSAKASPSPSIWDQAVNAFADLINWVAHYVGDYGIALIIVTIFIRLITMPLMLKSLQNSKKMQALKPQLDELKKEHGSDPRRFQEETMALYKAEGVNPLSGCMPMIIQFVVLTLLYRAIYTDHAMLYSKFLGLLPLGQPDHTFILPVLAGVTSYFQQRVTMVQMDPTQQKIMQIVFPLMIFFFALRVFAALSLYWVFSNIFTIAQMYFVRVKTSTQEVGKK